jgi:hypothetical protein
MRSNNGEVDDTKGSVSSVAALAALANLCVGQHREKSKL